MEGSTEVVVLVQDAILDASVRLLMMTNLIMSSTRF